MTQIICSIRYNSDTVLCFDPQKVLAKVRQAFPGVVVDPTDLSAAEVSRVTTFAQSLDRISAESQEAMRRQIAGKQQRMGPAFRFELAETFTGYANRYALVFEAESHFDDEVSQQVLALVETLEAGQVRVVDSSGAESYPFGRGSRDNAHRDQPRE